MATLKTILNNVQECRICEMHLPHGVRPTLQVNSKARILIAGQAPGSKVHESGIPFDDASGDRLREWMGINKATFYDATQIAILPMGFCYPGKGKSGDLPPRIECEPAWRRQILEKLPKVKLTLVLGQYAQAYHFGKSSKSLTELVKSWQKYWPEKVPLPHPSPRNNIWLNNNKWFARDVLPQLKRAIDEILNS